MSIWAPLVAAATIPELKRPGVIEGWSISTGTGGGAPLFPS